MKKYMLDLRVVENTLIGSNFCLLRLTADNPLPEMKAGQFVQVHISKSTTTFLRRPISIHFVDREHNELWLLVQLVGDGTHALATYQPGEKLNLVMPLGNGFPMPEDGEKELLLIGGGVGVAPMLYWGATLKAAGYQPKFLLAARSKEFILQLDRFKELGTTYVMTDDGSLGEKGLATECTALLNDHFDHWYVCGPKPMMVGVAKIAKQRNISCEVSLENSMACGIGACLCCVEKMKDEHHVCVCTEGPVFNTKELSWNL